MTTGRSKVTERGPEPDIREGDHGTALERIAGGEAAQAMQWAYDHRRDLDGCLTLIESEALEAEQANPDRSKGFCFYKLPRDGKTIIGPSIRLAEIVFRNLPNIAVGSRPIEATDTVVIAQGVARDWERNSTVFVETTRPILKRNGTRFGHAMIETTMKAARACAYRDAVMALVPKSDINRIVSQCIQIHSGESRTQTVPDETKRRSTAIEYFGRLGVSVPQILGLFRVSLVEDLTSKHLDDLSGFAAAIRDGETDVDGIFEPGRETTSQPDHGGGSDPLFSPEAGITDPFKPVMTVVMEIVGDEPPREAVELAVSKWLAHRVETDLVSPPSSPVEVSAYVALAKQRPGKDWIVAVNSAANEMNE